MLVREAMTAQPRCVRTRESAVDAVATMMTHRFRHLPVLDDEGQVVGLQHLLHPTTSTTTSTLASPPPYRRRAGRRPARHCQVPVRSRRARPTRGPRSARTAPRAPRLPPAAPPAALRCAQVRRDGGGGPYAGPHALLAHAGVPARRGHGGERRRRRRRQEARARGRGARGHLGQRERRQGGRAHGAPAERAPRPSRHSNAGWGRGVGSSVPSRCGNAPLSPQAVLVEAPRGRCVGILTPKDVLLRVVARGRSAAATSVEDVMTPAPDVMPGTATVLQALHQMQAPARFHPSHRVGGALRGSALPDAAGRSLGGNQSPAPAGRAPRHPVSAGSHAPVGAGGRLPQRAGRLGLGRAAGSARRSHPAAGGDRHLAAPQRPPPHPPPDLFATAASPRPSPPRPPPRLRPRSRTCPPRPRAPAGRSAAA